MAKKKKGAGAKRSSPKTAHGIAKRKVTKKHPKARLPVINKTEPEVISIGADNFWFTVWGSNLNNPVIPDNTNVLVFTDDSSNATQPIPNENVSFSTTTPGQFDILVKGISRKLIELRGSGKLKITVLVGPIGSRNKAVYGAKATVPD